MQNAAAPNPESPNYLQITGEAVPVDVGPGWLWTVSGPGVLFWGWCQTEYDAPGCIHLHILRVAEFWREAFKTGRITKRGLIHIPRIIITVPRRAGIVRAWRWTPWGLKKPY